MFFLQQSRLFRVDANALVLTSRRCRGTIEDNCRTFGNLNRSGSPHPNPIDPSRRVGIVGINVHVISTQTTRLRNGDERVISDRTREFDFAVCNVSVYVQIARTAIVRRQNGRRLKKCKTQKSWNTRAYPSPPP